MFCLLFTRACPAGDSAVTAARRRWKKKKGQKEAGGTRDDETNTQNGVCVCVCVCAISLSLSLSLSSGGGKQGASRHLVKKSGETAKDGGGGNHHAGGEALAEKDTAGESKTAAVARVGRGGRAGHSKKDWCMTDELAEFLCNLPRTALGRAPMSLGWCVRSLWALMDEKDAADAQDDAEGQPAQPMADFVVELFLRRCGFRERAEVELYQLITAVKEHYRHHALVHTFARCLGLLTEVAGGRCREMTYVASRIFWCLHN